MIQRDWSVGAITGARRGIMLGHETILVLVVDDICGEV